MASLLPYNNYSRAMRRAWPFDAFDDLFDAPLAAVREAANGFRMSVEDAGNAYVITAELPGVTREQIDVELNEGRLSVSVDKKETEEQQGKNYLRDEEKTHADGTTIPYAEAEEKFEVTYSIEGDLPAGLTAEPITGIAHGLRTNKPFEVVTGIKVAGTPTEAGEYVITVVANVPICSAGAGIWLSPSEVLTITQSFLVVVK